jgi:amidase
MSQAYHSRIKEVNGILHAVTEFNPDAYVIAAQLDAERANGTTRGYVNPIISRIQDRTDLKVHFMGSPL